MVVTSDEATLGDKEIKTDWPIEEGLVLGTTKRSAESRMLIPENDNTTHKDKEGIDY